MIDNTKSNLDSEFKMKDLGMMHYFIGMELWHNVDGISLGQGKYEVDILKRFRMMDCKAMTTPMESNLKLLSVASSDSVDAMMYRQMMCSLMYLMNTRPDIFFVVNTLRHVHLMVEKHAVRYLKGIVYYGIMYEANRLTWRVMWIHIGQEVPLIRRELRDVASV